MASYYVDPENGLDSNNGLSENTPWKLIPGQTGANTVLSGDIINIKNGTVSRQRVIAPADNLTYRGYGISSNKLILSLPSSSRQKRQVTVVREKGLHEGMWILDANGESTFGFFSFTTRSGCILEDCHIIAPLSDTPLSVGTSGSTAIGATIRRCRVSGSKATGINCYTRQVTIEDTSVEYTDDDGITFGATTANSNRAGYKDIVRRVSIIEPGLDKVAFLGDAIQTFPNAGAYEANLTISDIYVKKSTNVKQAFALNDGTGGILIENFLIESEPEGQAQILLSGIKGSIIVRNGWIINGCTNNAAVRIGSDLGVAMATGSRLQVYSVFVDAPQNSGFFTAGSAESAATSDGFIGIYNCVLIGENKQSLSFSAGLSCHAGAVITWGANAIVEFKNNVLFQSGSQPAIRLPVGGANDARWKVYNNAILSTTTAAMIGSTEYSTVGLFEAAHSYSGENLQEVEYYWNSFFYRVLPNSPLIAAGSYVTNLKDNNSTTYWNPPTIGAFEYIRPRTMRS